MKNQHLSNLVPPGADRSFSIWLVRAGEIFASAYAGILFLWRYHRCRDRLFTHRGSRPMLRPDAVIAPFSEIIHGVFVGFFIVDVLLLALAIWNYSTYRTGSMSIYLMRRLPDRSLLHRQCWTLPLIGLIISAALSLIILGLSWLIYGYATPAGCLPPA